jgi:hypothetical protein
MAYNLKIPLIFSDVYCLHVRNTQVRHHRFPEIRGEGQSIPDAVRHLMAKLHRGLDFVHGENREEFERAIAEVGTFHTPRPQEQSAPVVRRPIVGGVATLPAGSTAAHRDQPKVAKRDYAARAAR